MIGSSRKIREKVKIIASRLNRSNKYKNFDMERSDKQPKARSFGKTVANLIQRFLVVFVRFIFKNVIFDKGDSMQPIQNLLLLEPASVLAMKIRTKKVRDAKLPSPFHYHLSTVLNS